jgi:transcriptional regulator with XRE-family HTH domain
VSRRPVEISASEKKIGARISRIRKNRGLTQVELAEKMGITQSLLSRYERGVLRLHGQLVADFSKALKVSSDEILGLKQSKEDGLITDRRFLRRLQKMDDLSRRDKQALIRTIDGFLSGRAQRRN